MEKQMDIIEQPIDIIIKKKRGRKPTIKPPAVDEVIEKKKRGKKTNTEWISFRCRILSKILPF